MFHLLVKFDGWAEGRDSLPQGRVFEYTDADLIPLGADGAPTFDGLSAAPALFATEVRGTGPAFARVGSITHVRALGTKLELEYAFDGSVEPIPRSTLEKLARELAIETFELSRTHWSIKSVDLFRVLLANHSARAASPKVFRLDTAGIDAKQLSVLMPFEARFNDVFATIRDAAGRAGMACLRADDIWRNDTIIQDIVSLICTSRIVVADCTERNPNVFYETGICHSLGRDVILIAQSESDIPFDLRHLRYITYLDNGEGRQRLSEQLENRIRTLLSESSRGLV